MMTPHFVQSAALLCIAGIARPSSTTGKIGWFPDDPVSLPSVAIGEAQRMATACGEGLYDAEDRALVFGVYDRGRGLRYVRLGISNFRAGRRLRFSLIDK